MCSALVLWVSSVLTIDRVNFDTISKNWMYVAQIHVLVHEEAWPPRHLGIEGYFTKKADYSCKNQVDRKYTPLHICRPTKLSRHKHTR